MPDMVVNPVGNSPVGLSRDCGIWRNMLPPSAKVQVFIAEGYILLLAHFREQVQKITHGQGFAGAGLTPDSQMAGMVIAENPGEMAGQFLDLGVTDIGIEDFFQYRQLFGPDKLFIIQKAAVFDNGGIHHILDLVENLTTYFDWFHRKITSICSMGRGTIYIFCHPSSLFELALTKSREVEFVIMEVNDCLNPD